MGKMVAIEGCQDKYISRGSMKRNNLASASMVTACFVFIVFVFALESNLSIVSKINVSRSITHQGACYLLQFNYYTLLLFAFIYLFIFVNRHLLPPTRFVSSNKMIRICIYGNSLLTQ